MEIRLQRHGVLAGRVADAESREPVPGIPVGAWKVAFFRGRRALLPIGGAATDSKGHFRMTGLAPGEYLLEIGPERAEAIVPLPKDETRAEAPPGVPAHHVPGARFQSFPLVIPRRGTRFGKRVPGEGTPAAHRHRPADA